MIFVLLPTYPISPSTVTSSSSEKKKKNIYIYIYQRFRKHFFFSFHLRCCKNENLWWFSPYPVNTTIIWPTTDRIPHSLIFKRMQIKWIVDNIRAFSFVLTNWNKEPDKERIYRWGEFFHKLDNTKWKMRTGARATKQNYISIYISLCMKTFLKTGVYIYILYIYIMINGSKISIHRFIATMLFRVVKEWPHSSGNIHQWPLN